MVNQMREKKKTLFKKKMKEAFLEINYSFGLSWSLLLPDDTYNMNLLSVRYVDLQTQGNMKPLGNLYL